MKNYDIALSENANYLRADLHNTISQDIVIYFLSDLAQIASRNHINIFLIDARDTKSTVTTTENYEIGYKHITRLGFRPGSKFAMITDVDEMEPHKFIETLMINIGFKFRLFTEETAALHWLEEDSMEEENLAGLLFNA